MESERELERRLPETAPVFLCPACQCRLSYLGSYSGADRDSGADLADRYECPFGCGIYDFTRHTHRLRLAADRPSTPVSDATRPDHGAPHGRLVHDAVIGVLGPIERLEREV